MNSTLNTELMNENEPRIKGRKNSFKCQDESRFSKRIANNYTSINTTSINERKASIQSSRSQTAILGLLKHNLSKEKSNRVEFNEENIEFTNDN